MTKSTNDLVTVKPGDIIYFYWNGRLCTCVVKKLSKTLIYAEEPEKNYWGHRTEHKILRSTFQCKETGDAGCHYFISESDCQESRVFEQKIRLLRDKIVCGSASKFYDKEFRKQIAQTLEIFSIDDSQIEKS